MSTLKARPTLLSLLDRRFSARLTASNIEERVPDRKVLDALFDKNILHSAGVADSAECRIGPHDGDGMVPVERQADGSYTGFCAEHRRQISLPRGYAEWVEFDGEKWATEVRSRNGLEGDPSLDLSGRLFLGLLKTQTRRVALVAVSPQALGHSEVYKAPGSEDAPMVVVRLAEAPGTGAIGGDREIPSAEAFADDMLTLRLEALAPVLAALPNGLPAGTKFMMFSSAAKGAVPLTQDRYETEISAAAIKKMHVVIDLTRERAWRDGREVRRMKGSGKKLSPLGLAVVSGYFKVPGRAMRPLDVPPYRGREDSRSPTTAMVMLANMRATLRLDQVLKTSNNPTGTPGGSLYVFEPPASFKYKLIVAAPEA